MNRRSKSTSGVASSTQKRSRAGCRECRRLHRKCDETQPACLNCSDAGKTCAYSKPLSWGGRPFPKSPFGQALTAGVVAVPVIEASTAADGAETSSFIYSVAPAKRHSVNRFSKPTLDAQPLAPVVVADPCTRSIVRLATPKDDTSPTMSRINQTNPDWLPWLPTEHRSLLHYFAESVAPCFSLHRIHHRIFCTSLVPMALATSHGPHLLSAVLLAAATHQNALTRRKCEIDSSKLLQTCLRHLRRQDLGHSADLDNIAIATSLTLCLVDIMSGCPKDPSWRTHLKGALALLDSSEHFDDSKTSTTTRRVLWRWCRSFQTISLSCPSFNPGELTLSASLSAERREIETMDYIDLFDGFSTKLLPVFEEINDLCVERNTLHSFQLRIANHEDTEVLLELHSRRCDRLAMRIKAMIEQPIKVLDPWLPLADHDAQEDFMLLDRVYHYTALLEFYQRILDMPCTAADVQQAVKSGIEAFKAMKFHVGSCPTVATLHPIFTIGCSVCTAEDRAFVLDRLDRLNCLFTMGNVPSARLFLLELWQLNDLLRLTGSHLQWDKLMLQKGWDLALY
ncbi:hypothetical protein, variant [Exophiala sideris]|uniref:Zn(2)-C6 fungal-type domain-containing protein n=1 Tax=Exophiala sideris TaxID=1016849 RepID=A0A0D1YT16_9EURO|nr:hypothetical protein PV11_00362 [Exophiala sideris]KIV84590.1 hypothetical protein, variant [Exophiala sideris]